MLLDLTLTQEPLQLAGTARYTLIARRRPDQPLMLQADELRIDSVRVGRTPADFQLVPFEQARDTLMVPLDAAAVQPDMVFYVEVAYQTAPERPSAFRASSTPQGTYVWADGARTHPTPWFPRIDQPADKLTSEVILRVPEAMDAFAAGERVTEAQAMETRVSHFFQDQPHAVDHLAFVAGAFEVYATEAVLTNGRRLSILAAGPPDRAALLGTTLPHVPDLLAFFAREFGVVYPWPALTVAFVPRLDEPRHHGTGVLVLPEGLLRDADTLLDADELRVWAEAIARQWTDHVVTPVPSASALLRDGLARYMALRYAGEAMGTEAASAIRDTLQRCAAAPLVDPRPLVVEAPSVDPNDAEILTCRAAAVMQQLHRELGPSTFTDVVRSYMRRHAFWAADADAFRSALLAAGGDTPSGLALLDPTFRWAPVVLRAAYEPAGQRLRLTPVGDSALPPGFELPVLAVARDGVDTLVVSRGPQDVDLARSPWFLVADPEGVWPVPVRVEQSPAAWVAQLRNAPAAVHRADAAHALRTFADDPALGIGLREALRTEASPRVRQAILETLGVLPPSSSISTLLTAHCADDDALVRAAALRSLRSHPASPASLACAFDRAQNDRAAVVQAEAVRTLVVQRAPDAADVVRSALVTPSRREQIRRAALESVARSPLSPREAEALLLRHARADLPLIVRSTATRLLGGLPSSETIRAHLREALAAPEPELRRSAIQALREHGDEASTVLLEARVDHEPCPTLRRLIMQDRGPASN